MSWEKLKDSKNRGSLFLRLKDGDAVLGVFRGDPYCFYQKFKDFTEYDEWEEGRSFKFKINFALFENGTIVPKILQGGATIRDYLIAVKEKYGLDALFELKRTGSGKDDTIYHLLYERKLTPDEIAEVKNLPLLDLKKKKVEVVEEESDVPF